MDFGYFGIRQFSEMVPWIVGASVLIVLLFISLKIWRSIFGRKVRSIGVESGMKFQDLDTMRKKGLISEEEFKNVRAALARRESERSRDSRAVEQDMKILAEVAYNPDAARKLLPPEVQQAGPAATAGPLQSVAASATVQPPTPSMNSPRVVAARATAEANPNQPRDIDLLLQKGAISQEEYDRLKKFFE